MSNHKNLKYLIEEYGLTAQQEQVLIRRILKEKSYSEIAEELETSENACQKAMGEIYKKFGISGQTRGKERRLRKLFNFSSTNKTYSDNFSQPIENNFSDSLVSENKININFKHLLSTQFRTTTNAQAEKNINPFSSFNKLIKEIEKSDDENQSVQKLLESIPIIINQITDESSPFISQILIELIKTIQCNYFYLFYEKSEPLFKENLKFLLKGEHSLARSLFAFISRTFKQFKIDNFEPWQILIPAIYQISLNKELYNKFSDAPSAVIRLVCFEQILELRNFQKAYENDDVKTSSPSILVSDELREKNMRSVLQALSELKALSELPEQDPDFDSEFKNILYNRVIEGMSYERLYCEGFVSQEKYSAEQLKVREEILLKKFRDKFHRIMREDLLEVQSLDFMIQDPLTNNQIILYSILSTHKTLNDLEIEQLKLVLKQAIGQARLDFWINEIDHFIAHERNDLKDCRDHIKYETQQKNKICQCLKEKNYLNSNNQFSNLSQEMYST